MDDEAAHTSMKHELWNKIQLKRKAKGLEELQLNQEHVKKPEMKLTQEEIDKINLRRKRNRIAAQKSRNRRKQRCDALRKLVEQLTEKQQELEREISMLRSQKDQLHLMTNHLNCKLVDKTVGVEQEV